MKTQEFERILREAEGLARVSTEALVAWALVLIADLLPELQGSRVVAEWGSCAPRAASSHTVGNGAHPSVRIVLAWWIGGFGGAVVLRQLLHELVHAAVAVSGATEDSYHGHGPLFCGLANRVGPALGVAPVAPRGRGGAGEPSFWPHAEPLGQRTSMVPVEPALTAIEARALREEIAAVRRARDAATVRAATAEGELVAVLRLVGGSLRKAERTLADVVKEHGSSGGSPARARAVVVELSALAREVEAKAPTHAAELAVREREGGRHARPRSA